MTAATERPAPQPAPAATPATPGDSPEWRRRPFRIRQTSIREVGSGMDVRQVVRDTLDFGCNT
jgi:hypothetical protein